MLFDLDGTLLDSLADLAESMNAVLIAAGHPPHEINTYKRFVGDGVACLVRRALPTHTREEATVESLVTAMRSEYTRRCEDKTGPYDGIEALLGRLAERDIAKAVLSNKPDDLTRRLVANLLAGADFAIVMGASTRRPRKPAPDAALEIARRLAVDPAAVLYLGDTDTDMRTAEAAGMHPVGALWGFRDEAELRASGARDVVAHPLDVLALL